MSAPNGSSRNIMVVAGRSASQLNQPTMRPLWSSSDWTSRSPSGGSGSYLRFLSPDARSNIRMSWGSTWETSGETACNASTAPRKACRCSASR